MKLTKEIEKKLKSFTWRYVEEIEGPIYFVKAAKDFKKVDNIRIGKHAINFWHEDCGDHAERICLEDILIFD